MSYKFTVGQKVNFTPGMMHSAPAGPYEICRLMPEGDADRAHPRYRIKSVAERHERVVSESDLTPYNTLDCLFT
jgi:hypothetical protein